VKAKDEKYKDNIVVYLHSFADHRQVTHQTIKWAQHIVIQLLKDINI